MSEGSHFLARDESPEGTLNFYRNQGDQTAHFLNRRCKSIWVGNDEVNAAKLPEGVTAGDVESGERLRIMHVNFWHSKCRGGHL